MFKNKTKIIAIFLALILLFSTTSVFANNEVQEDSYKKSDVYLSGCI